MDPQTPFSIDITNTSPVHCSLLAEDAIKSAIKDYKKKRDTRLGAGATSQAASAPQAVHA
jgi:hypothetical protein